MLARRSLPWIFCSVVLAAGCGGKATMVGVDPGSRQLSQPTATTAPVVVPATPAPYVPSTPAVAAQLQANIKQKKNGSFLGSGKIVVTVQVKNPTTVPLIGELKVTFTDGGKPTAKVQTKQVALQAGESQDHTFEDPSWMLDDATVEVKTLNGGYDPHGGSPLR